MITNNTPGSIFRSVDKWCIFFYLLAVVAGWLSIYGASYDFDQVSTFSLSERTGMQLIWIGTAFLFAFLLLLIDRHYLETYAYIYYIFALLLLLVTIFVAPDIKGSRSWLVMGPLRLQPAEFAKVATALALSRLLSNHGFKLEGIKNYTIALAIILLPMLMVILQKETGGALIFCAFLIVLYAEGMSGMVLLAGASMALFFIFAVKFPEEILEHTPLGSLIDLILVYIMSILLLVKNGARKVHFIQVAVGTVIVMITGMAVYYYKPYDLSLLMSLLLLLLAVYLLLNAFFYRAKRYAYTALFVVFMLFFVDSVEYAFNDVLEPYQQMRIKVTLGLEDDPSGAGYNVNQSKIAIGSGGFWGKGFLNGTQTKLKYVPEQDTDFIFCTVGEEFGFVGTLAVIALFTILILRILFLADKCRRTPFVRIYGYCVASVLMTHIVINIGMVIGIMPVIGIPLPFFSYGGSSLWGFTLLLFIFLKLSASVRE